MTKICIWCGKRRKVNPACRCRECQTERDDFTMKQAYSILIDGTGEDEDRIAEKVWEILDQ